MALCLCGAGLDYDKCMMEALMAFKRAGADAILTYAAPWASRKIIGAVPTLPAEGDPAQAPFGQRSA